MKPPYFTQKEIKEKQELIELVKEMKEMEEVNKNLDKVINLSIDEDYEFGNNDPDSNDLTINSSAIEDHKQVPTTDTSHTDSVIKDITPSSIDFSASPDHMPQDTPEVDDNEIQVLPNPPEHTNSTIQSTSTIFNSKHRNELNITVTNHVLLNDESPTLSQFISVK